MKEGKTKSNQKSVTSLKPKVCPAPQATKPIHKILAMTEEQFKEFTEEVIPQQLFHVYPTDTDDESGGKLDETILVGLIANRPACLKHKPLRWFIENYLYDNKEWKA